MSVDTHFSVTLLGTGAPMVNPARACASTVVAAGDRAFLVDTGRGFYDNLAPTGSQEVDQVKKVSALTNSSDMENRLSNP